MGNLHAEFGEADQVWVSDVKTGARLEFTIVTDKAGRRHLRGPHRGVSEMIYGRDSLRQACVLAQSEALHAGKVDY